MRAVTACIVKATGDVLAMLQYLSPRERVKPEVSTVMSCIAKVPSVVDWLRRSACRQGATMALTLGLAHYPDDFDVADVTSGFPSEDGEATPEEIAKIMAKASPYADRVLEMVDLEDHQASATAPEDAEEGAPAHQDYPADKFFTAAQSNELTTYPVPVWAPKFILGDQSSAEASSSK